MEEVEPTRVLLDVLPGVDSDFDESFLARNGLSVSVCSGPGDSQPCPLVEGHGCRKFEEANGVVFALDLDEPEHRAVIERYQELAREGTPSVWCSRRSRPTNIGRSSRASRCGRTSPLRLSSTGSRPGSKRFLDGSGHDDIDLDVQTDR